VQVLTETLRKIPTTKKAGENVAVAQYASIKSALERILNVQGWTVSQRSFIAGARSLNEKDLHDNLAYFKVPEAGITSIRSKLDLKYLMNMQIS
jgi:hypothetical protein